jgi:Flp pilus assembly pilin Flp
MKSLRHIRLFRDRRGSAIYQYALVAALVGILMLATMGAMRVAAGHNISTTQNGLSNESSAP